MKYMVLECHPGYAVVLDENGRFLKVANRQYEIGQMVAQIVQMRQLPRNSLKKWLYPLSTLAACLALVLGLILPGIHQPYASVYVKINPEVRIDVDKADTVVGLEGVNQDGIDLIEGYNYRNKPLDLVTDELIDRAIDMGYLHQDGQITISLDSQDQTWVQSHTQAISSHLQTHLQERIAVTIEIKLCTHEHPGRDHRDYDYDDDDHDADIFEDSKKPDRIESQSKQTGVHDDHRADHDHDHASDDDDNDDDDDIDEEGEDDDGDEDDD